jgi:hypothetical protein
MSSGLPLTRYLLDRDVLINNHGVLLITLVF